jgi:hypothetical protein
MPRCSPSTTSGWPDPRGAAVADDHGVIAELDHWCHHRLALALDGLDDAGRLDPAWTARQVSDVLWAASAPVSYELLVVERGWSAKAFERWLIHLARSFQS